LRVGEHRNSDVLIRQRQQIQTSTMDSLIEDAMFSFGKKEASRDKFFQTGGSAVQQYSGPPTSVQAAPLSNLNFQPFASQTAQQTGLSFFNPAAAVGIPGQVFSNAGNVPMPPRGRSRNTCGNWIGKGTGNWGGGQPGWVWGGVGRGNRGGQQWAQGGFNQNNPAQPYTQPPALPLPLPAPSGGQ
jgi:hypothetical protein